MVVKIFCDGNLSTYTTIDVQNSCRQIRTANHYKYINEILQEEKRWNRREDYVQPIKYTEQVKLF